GARHAHDFVLPLGLAIGPIYVFAGENGCAVTNCETGLNATFTRTNSVPAARLKRQLKLPRHVRVLVRTVLTERCFSKDPPRSGRLAAGTGAQKPRTAGNR